MKIPLTELADRESFKDVLLQYSRALDRCDTALMRDVYWSEARHDHRLFVGGGDEFATFAVTAARRLYLLSQHSLSNLYFRFDEQRWHVESYVYAYHKIANEPEMFAEVFGTGYLSKVGRQEAITNDCLLYGRYVDVLERRSDEWRIISRVVLKTGTINQPGTVIHKEPCLAEGIFLRGVRDHTDISYPTRGPALERNG